MVAFFEKITNVLDECNIPYMLSGSVAMSLYIVPRATRDFDFIVNIRPEDVEKFVERFKDNYYCDIDAVNDAIRYQSLFNIIDYSSGFKADFVVLKKEPFRQMEFSRRIQMDFYGKVIFVVSPEDLIISKLIWIQDLQSAVQMEDVKSLIKFDDLNWNYIKTWIAQLKLNTFNLINYE